MELWQRKDSKSLPKRTAGWPACTVRRYIFVSYCRYLTVCRKYLRLYCSQPNAIFMVNRYSRAHSEALDREPGSGIQKRLSRKALKKFFAFVVLQRDYAQLLRAGRLKRISGSLLGA
jgi:hypothetical protein